MAELTDTLPCVSIVVLMDENTELILYSLTIIIHWIKIN